MPPEILDRGDDWTPTEDAADVAAKLGTTPSAADEEAAAVVAAELAATEAAKVAKAAEPAAAAEGETKAKDTRLPLARHQAILDAERDRRAAVEAELAQYKQGGKIADVGAAITVAETELVALEAKYAKELTDGEHKDAAATMSLIRRTERAITEKNTQLNVEAAEARAVERVRYDTTVDRIEAQYPQLTVGHADFDKDKTAEVLQLKEAWQKMGFTPSAALQKAVTLLMPPATPAQEKVLVVTPQVDAKAVEAARKAAAVAATAAAVGKTPASSASAGKDSDTAGGGAVTAKDILKMPYADFVKVDETTLAKARGDLL